VTDARAQRHDARRQFLSAAQTRIGTRTQEQIGHLQLLRLRKKSKPKQKRKEIRKQKEKKKRKKKK
jgi:hypothetical protein